MKNRLLFITLLACFTGWGQGSEDFTNSALTASYLNGSFIGNNSITWSYIASRNEDTYAISGKGIMLRRSSDNSKVTSSSVSNGIGNFTCSLKKAFTGSGNRQAELFINGVSKGTSIAWDNTTTQTFLVNNINISGNIVIEIRNITANQLIVDDILWTAYTAPTSTTYTTSWTNSAPTASIDAIIDGDLTTSTDLACKDLTINANRTLTIAAGNKLTVSGNLINNGTIVFKSNATSTAMFGVFNGTQSGSGVVTTERYIPAKRAFRFLSPSVTTTTSIKLNWQENAGTTAGLGTHITGVDGATNGFDATATNNPSLYTFDNSTGAWVAVTSTLSNTLTAGTPYRLMVRGDRLVNLTTNTPIATETVLRATGTLKTGSFSPTLNQAVEGFSFVGNPYQAPLDIEAVLNAATNMNTGVAYYWDPTLNARGGYVARNLTTNSNDVTSNFNEFLQPGQAIFVKKANTASAASLTIIESHKSVANGAAGVFRTTTPNDYGLLRVNLQANNNNQWQTIEGTLAIFNSGFNTAVTDEDATKMANLDEEVSFVQNNTSLAIACQPNPTATTELPIRLTNTRYTNYQWKFDLTNYSGPTPFLVDTQNNSITQITNTTVVPFTTDSNANRFKIVFQNALLNTDTFATQVGLYPNPSKGNGFYLQLPSTAQATVRLYNTLGQEIAISHNEGHYQAKQSLAAGVYHIMVTQGEKTSKLKWIVE